MNPSFYDVKLQELINTRKALFSDDEKIQKKNDKQIDELAEQVWAFVREHREKLSVEQMIESITHLGAAPSILYDDNGHFTIGGKGHQNLPTFEDGWETKETYFEGGWTVKPGGWKKTIREALSTYLDERE